MPPRKRPQVRRRQLTRRVWHLYILRCADDSLYTGITTDLKRREAEHNAGRGSRAVRARRPAKVIYRERFRTRSRALRREAEIKCWPRPRKLNLIRRRSGKARPRS